MIFYQNHWFKGIKLDCSCTISKSQWLKSDGKQITTIYQNNGVFYTTFIHFIHMMVIMVTVWCLMLRVFWMAIHIQNPSVHILQYHFSLHCKLQLFVVEPVKLEVKLLIFGSYHREKWHICWQNIVNHSFRTAYLLWNNNSVCLSVMSLALLKIN